MIRVVIADDMSASRALLEGILTMEGDFEVVGRAGDGAQAVALTRQLKPDLVTMDIEMPGMDGFEATQRIMSETPRPIIIVSGTDVSSVAVALNATRAGALSVVPKPPAPGSADFEAQARHLLTMARAMSKVKLLPQVQQVRAPAAPAAAGAPQPAAAPPARVKAGNKARIIGIAASTGGPPALNTILSELPADFRAPILVVQHIATGFAQGLATWLASTSQLRVKVAEHGEQLVPGTVYLAPDNRHLGVAEGRVALADGPPVDGFRPSGTHLFDSLARAYGGAALGLILTGMGRDGVAGLAALRAAGGTVVAQDEGSSVIYGMNGEAVLGGLTDEVLPLDALAYLLMQSV
jgi:two-component system chemotaxis response regulator CheB